MSVIDKFFIREYGKEKGSAPTLVFIHGLLGWGLNWGPIVKYFESEFHVVTYDQRGHGRSTHRPDSGYTPDDYANDLKDILDEMDIKSAHIVGHSMGGRAAQNFAVRFPGHTLSLVIEDIGPNPENASTLSTQQMILSVPVPFDSKEAMDRFFETEFKVKTASEDTQKSVMGNFLKANLSRRSDGKIDWRFKLSGVLETLEVGLEPRWSEFKCIDVPTLIMRGENSKHLSAETFELMKEELPQAESVIIPNVGHWIHYQAPELFSQYVLKFLHKLS